jgi:ABC-type transporter Mla MlaB component
MTQDLSTPGHLSLDGALTMRSVEALFARLRETLAQHSEVSIDCTAAAEVDLSFIQLLVAARASAVQADKTVALAARPDGPLLQALTRAGFRVTQEDQPADSETFWFEGAAA